MHRRDPTGRKRCVNRVELELFFFTENWFHLSHVQQEDLEEEAQGAACDLVGGSADGITQLAPKRETVPSNSLLKEEISAPEDRSINMKSNK